MTVSDLKPDANDCWSIVPKNASEETLRERFSDTDKALIDHLNECEVCRRLCYAMINKTPEGVRLSLEDEKFFSREQRDRRTLRIIDHFKKRRKILERLDDLLG